MFGKVPKQGGQATLEYLLLLFVIVALLAGALMKFSKQFVVFGNALVGEQLRCALEYGQLPSQLPPGVCDPPEFSGSAGGNGSGSGSGGNNTNNNDSSNSSGDRSAGNSEGSDSSGGSAGGSSGADGSVGGIGKNSRKFAANDGNGGGDGDSKSDSDEGGISRGTRKINVVNETVVVGDKNRSRYIPIIGSQDANENGEKGEGLSVKDDSGGPKNSKKIPVILDDRKPAEMPPDEPMTIGNFLKYILIAAIILALVVFFGNQFMSFQRSKD